MRYLPFLVVAGAAIYLVIWFAQSRARRGAPGTGPARAPRRPLAPDDDPEFLAELDRRRRREQGRAATGPVATGGPTPSPGAAPPGTTPAADAAAGAAPPGPTAPRPAPPREAQPRADAPGGDEDGLGTEDPARGAEGDGGR